METSFHLFIPWWVASEVNCCCSVTKSCLILCNPMDCSTPGSSVLHHLPEFAQTHVCWFSDAIQPSHPLSPTSPSALNLSQLQSSNELALPIRCPKDCGTPHTEVPLPPPETDSAVLSYFLLLLLRRDARNCCPVKIIITAARAGVESWTHQRPKDLSLLLGHAQCLWLQNCLNDLLISWHRLSPKTCGCPSASPQNYTHLLPAWGHQCRWLPRSELTVRKDLLYGLRWDSELGCRDNWASSPSPRLQKLLVYSFSKGNWGPCQIIPTAYGRPLSSEAKLSLMKREGQERPAHNSDFCMAPRPPIYVLKPEKHTTLEQAAPGGW